MRESSCASVASSTGSPFHTIRSLISSRCGLVYTPTDRPDASSRADVMRATDVLPFVPVRWISGYDSCGDPSSSTSASMRSSVGAVARRSAPGGSPVDSRLTWASSQARAAPMSKSGRVFGEVDLDRELVGFEELDRGDATGILHVPDRRFQGVESFRRIAHDRELNLGAQRLLSCRLGLANLAQDVSGDAVREAIGSADLAAQRLGVRPRGPVNGVFLPPRPHLFGHERQVRCEQSKQCRKRELERATSRQGADVVAGAIGTLLHELDVIVAEAPEELLGPLQSARVVVSLERAARVLDQVYKRSEHRPVEFGRGRSARDRGVTADAERELRRVQDLDRESPADLDLAL